MNSMRRNELNRKVCCWLARGDGRKWSNSVGDRDVVIRIG